MKTLISYRIIMWQNVLQLESISIVNDVYFHLLNKLILLCTGKLTKSL